MGKRGRRVELTEEDRARIEVDGICRRLGLPTSESPESIIGAIMGALDPEILIRYDDYVGNDGARLAYMFGEPSRALWLAAGLRIPLLRAQLRWLLSVLRRADLAPGFCVVDLGSGVGLTAAVLAKAFKSRVTAIDPQPGSKAAATWVANQLGVEVEAWEGSSVDWPSSVTQSPDVLVAQAILWYLQPTSDRRNETLAALVANPPKASLQMAQFLDRCAASRIAVVMDHDYRDLWVLVLAGLAERGMFPDWSSAELVGKKLPNGYDRQLSVVFTRSRQVSHDLLRLESLLSSPRHCT